ncbi:CUB and sushi domain-containing protein 3-like [Branchiostoma lanceolatum]|uniref:CUB and sushi domain-containing protein 3-like n=1 Tax=Branchiostoma lanceolatum TaxID=7740 RepID=UPI0034514A8F
MNPTFSNCPGDITAVAPPMKTEANVLWLAPTATDNSGSTPTVDVDITTSLGPVNFLQRIPPIWFQEGQYTVTYTASDQEGNRATCDFSIHVQVTRCSQLGTPANGKTTPDPCGVLRGSRCDFSCDSGYNRVGADASTCQDDGSWTNPSPTCEVVYCSSLSAPPNTAMSGCYGTSSEPYGKVCHFDCNAGYTIKRGSRSRQCLADGSWSGTELECEVETCSGLPIPPDGAISPSTCTSQSNYGTVCHLSCDVGYRTSGPTEQTCNPGGQWSDQGKPTTCIDTQPPTFTNCPPDQTVYAGSGETSATVTWTVPTATDNSGVTPTVTRVEGDGPGSTFAEGAHSIKYTAVDSAGRNSDCSFRITVKAVYCSTLNAPPSGRITCNQNDRRYGTTCQFQCNLGYQLVGNHTSSCEKDSYNVGFWTSSAPTCEIVTCHSLNTPAHGIKSGCNNAQEDYNTVCTFYCNKGYSPKTSIKRTCQQNGTWSGSSLTCTIDTCTALSPIQRGAINPSLCTSSPAYNDVCTYSCETGYTLVGSRINKCLDGGRWQNNNSVSCQDITKPVFHGCPSDIYVTADGGEGSVNVTWTPPTATDSTGNAPAVTSTGLKTIFDEGSHHVIYTAEDAAGNIAKCQFTVVVTVHRCRSLPPPAFGQFVSTCNNLRGSSCSMECHTGYRLTGSAIRTCVVTNNGTASYWDGVETKCEIFRCSPLSRPSHGTITPTACTVQPVAGTHCTFNCLSGFELQNGINATECNATGHWSPSASSTPSCRDIQPPVFTSCPSDVFLEPGAGLGTVLVNWDKPTATDNTAVTITVSPNGTEPPSVFSVGTHVVTYIATDSAGLAATCSFSVIIRDNEEPNITCPSDIEQQTSSPPVAVSWVDPIASQSKALSTSTTVGTAVTLLYNSK